jgi:hypothetical protein
MSGIDNLEKAETLASHISSTSNLTGIIRGLSSILTQHFFQIVFTQETLKSFPFGSDLCFPEMSMPLSRSFGRGVSHLVLRL